MKKLLVLPISLRAEEVFSSLFEKTVQIKTLRDLETELTTESVLLFGGGEDISPKIYKETPSMFTTTAEPSQRDVFERRAFLDARLAGAKCLGICRGAQLLCALSGGKLVQHVTGHGQDHDIVTHDGKIFETSSVHHQMMYPTENSPHELIATAAPSLSSIYIFSDDNIKRSVPYEAEIVYFTKTQSLGIQGHPEFMSENALFVDYCRSLVKEYLL